MCPPSDLSTAHATSTTNTTSLNTPDVIPKTQISMSAFSYAQSILAPPILNHSIRVYLYATALALEKPTSAIYITDAAKHDLLFTACIFHDIGTTSAYNGSSRFEVDGADAAVQHLSKHNVSDKNMHDVWTAIACHTSPHIAERIGELSRLVRIAVITDFGKNNDASSILETLRAKLESDFARDGIEKCLGDAVVEQAKEKPEKAPAVSWPNALLSAALAEPEWDGVNKAF